MDSAIILSILATAGVASILLFACKGLLDQQPELAESFKRARMAWKDAWADSEEPQDQTAGGNAELPAPAEDETK